MVFRGKRQEGIIFYGDFIHESKLFDLVADAGDQIDENLAHLPDLWLLISGG